MVERRRPNEDCGKVRSGDEIVIFMGAKAIRCAVESDMRLSVAKESQVVNILQPVPLFSEKKGRGNAGRVKDICNIIGARSDVIPYIRPMRLGSCVGQAERQQACQYDPEPIFKSDF
jgi:hypothetical protein